MDRLGRRARAAPQRKADPLSESEEEPDAQLATELPTAAKEVDPVGQALVKLTQLVETLSAPKRRSPSTLDSLLDAAGSGASGSQEAAPSLRCNAAARRALRAALVDNPCISGGGLMKEDLHSLQTPGFEVPRSARAWLEHRSRIGSHQTLARTSWAVAGALDAARRKGLGRVRGQAQRVDGGHGPGRHRPGVLDSRERPPAGGALPTALFQSSRGSRAGRGSSLVSNPGREVGGGGFASSSRSVRFSGKEGQAQSTSRAAAGGGGQGDQPPGREGQRERWREKARGGKQVNAEPAHGAQRTTPGASAPAINVPGFWNSLPSWILKGHGARTTTIAVNASAHSPQTWPCPPPYPEVFSRSVGGAAGWRKVQTCLVIVLLSWLHLGSPAVCPDSCRVGGKLSPNQWRMVRTIEGLTWDSDFSDPIVASEMGRSVVSGCRFFFTASVL